MGGKNISRIKIIIYADFKYVISFISGWKDMATGWAKRTASTLTHLCGLFDYRACVIFIVRKLCAASRNFMGEGEVIVTSEDRT